MSMGRFIFALVMLLIASAVRAGTVNYFQEGSSWLYSVKGVGPHAAEYDILMTLEGEEEIAGYKAVGLYREITNGKPNRVLCTYIRCEERKVYFLADEETADWRLLYDFGLEEGETATVWWFNGTMAPGNIDLHSDFIRVEDHTEMAGYPELTKMRIARYLNEEEFERDPDSWDENNLEWIAGIGSLCGPLNNTVGGSYEGAVYRLLEVRYAGKAVYRDQNYNGVEDSYVERFEVAVSCGEICVSGVCVGVSVHSTDGTAQQESCEGVYSGLEKGVYVVKCGGVTKKVLVP